MKTGKRIFKNTMSLAAGKGLGDLASFFFLIFFARVFGISIFGQYIFAMSLAGFLSILVHLGLNTLATREISKDKKKDADYIGNLLIAQSALALFTWGLIGVFVWLSSFDANSKLIILIIGAYQVLYSLTQLVFSRFQAHEEMEFSALLEILHKLFILILGSILIVVWEDAVLTLLVYPLSALGMISIGFTISTSRYGKPNYTLDIPFTRELLSKALPFLILTALFQFYDRVGIVLLTLFQGDDATGIYAASDRFLVPMITGIGMFAAALFPVISRYARDSRQMLITAQNRSVRIVVVSVLPMTTFLYLLSEEIILLVYGAEFSESASVLNILSWVILPFGLSLVLSRVLVALDLQKELARMQLLIFSGFLVACLIFIPLYSYTALAYAKVFTSVVLCVAYAWYLSKTIPQRYLLGCFKSPFIACLVAAIAFNLMSDQSLWLSIPSALAACIITLFVTGGVNRHDLSYIKNSL